MKLTLGTLMIFLCLPLNLRAGQIPGVKPTKLHLEVQHAIGTNRHWAIPRGEKKQGELNGFFELRNNPEWFYSRTNIHSFFTNTQFRYVSLTQEFGVEPGLKGIEVFVRHRSEHGIDFEPNIDYLNNNGIGIRFKFID